MGNRNFVQVEGLVKESLPGLLFRVAVKIDNEEKEVLAHLGGKLKFNRIKVLPGDRVIVEMPSLKDKRGRIVKRL